MRYLLLAAHSRWKLWCISSVELGSSSSPFLLSQNSWYAILRDDPLYSYGRTCFIFDISNTSRVLSSYPWEIVDLPTLKALATPFSSSIETISGWEETHFSCTDTEVNWTEPPLRTLTYLPGERALPMLTTIESIKFLPGRMTERIQIPCSLLAMIN